MKTLLDRLCDLPLRETGGADASNRFRYQHHVAVELLMDELERGENFILVCEHHEDLLIVWPERDLCSPIQVKTRTASKPDWNASTLCAQKKSTAKRASGKGLGSPLGKLVATARRIGFDDLKEAVFLSNRRFKVTLGTKAESHSQVFLSDVVGKCRENLDASLLTELGSQLSDSEQTRIVMRQARLTLGDFEAQLRGRLSKVLEASFGAEATNAGPLLKTLQSEIARRSSVADAAPDEVIGRKAVTAVQMRAWFLHGRGTRREHSFSAWWASASADPHIAGVPPWRRRVMRQAAREIAVRLLDPDAARALEDDLAVVEELLERDPDVTTESLLATAAEYARCGKLKLAEPALAVGLILNMLFGNHEELQAAHSSAPSERK